MNYLFIFWKSIYNILYFPYETIILEDLLEINGVNVCLRLVKK